MEMTNIFKETSVIYIIFTKNTHSASPSKSLYAVCYSQQPTNGFYLFLPKHECKLSIVKSK